ncbi:hypothetical protein PUMCH_004819 [Australozyma saopauloensis]|uniref:Anaphase-promoting complex subunit 4 WD40 domain-containing protein n=1 Tax=Australozyma saopauloensis TaxID=291208 RepID=A0AAX4HH97_9ASCO|nr:hypothetical protein PUMCH_004819 [[Candida] saopauloensis]
MAQVWNIQDTSSPILLCKLDHTLAVKGIAFCPWAPNLLATGGGSNDRHLRFWHTGTGTLLHETNTGKQITSITWSVSRRELVLTFGFDEESPGTIVAVYGYPRMDVRARAQAKDRRALSAEVSPDQTKIAVATSDGTVRLYQLWEPRRNALRATFSGTGPFSSPIINMIEGLESHNGYIR